jgi:NACHT domain
MVFVASIKLTASPPAPFDFAVSLDPVDAGYRRSSGPVARCLHGTRERLIGDVVQWVDSGSDRPICWLNGPAGSGKSAVSHSIAELCNIRNRLAASFFFFRGGDRSRIARFIPTLAYQLSVSVPATKPFMQRVLQRDPLIIREALSYQFTKLMIEPILSTRNHNLAPTNPMVIVIDGLDECDDKELMAQFIEIITDACQVDNQFPFRIFFTSRVEEHLRKKLEAHSSIYPLLLLDYNASGDIRKFFQSRFSTIQKENYRLMQNVPLPWPSDWDLDTLVGKASGSFIFASTLINFVDDGSDLPHRKLPIALTAHAGLDPLYTQVLSAAPCGPHFKQVINTIILLKSPPSITFLGNLLQLEAADVLQALLGIQSILMIPGDNDHSIQLFHTSLRDFLTTESRSDAFFIGPAGHIDIMIDCLEVMLIPPEDGIFFAGNAQEYACNNWCYHFDQAMIKGGYNLIDSPTVGSLMSCLKHFFSHSFDMWINTLILKSKSVKVLNAMGAMLWKLKVSWMCVMILISSNNSPSSNLQIVHNSCYKLWKILVAVQRYDFVINLQDCINTSVSVKYQSVSVQIMALFDINVESVILCLGCK